MSIFVKDTIPSGFRFPPATITKAVAKVINIWWVFLLLGLLPAALPAQFADANQQAVVLYNKALSNLKSRPTLCAYQAQQAAELAQQARNTSLESGSYLLMGKAFIAQNDWANARKFLKRGISAGRSIKSAPLVIEGATLLSSISIRARQYQQAYDELLTGINAYNEYQGSKGIQAQDNGETRKLRKQVVDLTEQKNALEIQLSLLQQESEEAFAGRDSVENVNAELNRRIQELTLSENAYREEIEQLRNEPRGEEFEFLGIPGEWWLYGLGLLSLGLLSGLLWLASNQRQQKALSEEQETLQLKENQLLEKIEQQNEVHQEELRKKDLLIQDYELELDQLKSSEGLEASLFAGSTQHSVSKEAGLMYVEVARDSSKSDRALAERIERELPLMVAQHPKIYLTGKIGPTLLFVSDETDPSALISLAEELQEYFEDPAFLGWNAKIAVHSGPVIFARSERSPQGLDIWGAALDQCHWLLRRTAPGQLTITSDARDLLTQPEGWTYLGEETDHSAKAIRIFKKT